MSEFVSYLHEVLHHFGVISSRRMFGGHGIYHQGLMFALVADDNLYFKTDPENLAQFVAAGSTPFQYTSQGQQRSIAYYTAPEACLDDPEQACYWAKLAFAAAVRAKAQQTAKPAARKKRSKKAASKKILNQ